MDEDIFTNNLTNVEIIQMMKLHDVPCAIAKDTVHVLSEYCKDGEHLIEMLTFHKSDYNAMNDFLGY